MNITGRILRWILPGILCCGGCATPALVDTSEATTSQLAVDDHQRGGDTTAPSDSSAETGQRERATIDSVAQQSGIPEEQATRLAEIFLNAYADMNREVAQSAAGPISPPEAVDGVPVPVAAAAAASPAPTSLSGQHSDSPRTFSAASAEKARASRQATSAYPASEKSEDPRQSAAAVRQVSVELGRPREAAPRGHRPPDLGRTDVAANAADHPDRASERRVEPTEVEPDAANVSNQKSCSPDGRNESASWSRQVRSAIEQLRIELDNETLDEEQRARHQVCLSLLQLAVEDRDKAVESLADLDDQQLEFWRQTVMGMGLLLNSDELPKLRHRVEAATEHLSQGVQALSSLGPLRLLHVSLCTKVDGFGDFVECNAYGLEPGKPVILYVEVENFTAERVQADAAREGWARNATHRDASSDTPRYVTELHGRYEIFDANQRTVVSRTLPVGGDTCRNQRRDYYISYVLYMPENIAPGAYTLELTIEDKKGDKFGNAVVDFRVR